MPNQRSKNKAYLSAWVDKSVRAAMNAEVKRRNEERKDGMPKISLSDLMMEKLLKHFPPKKNTKK